MGPAGVEMGVTIYYLHCKCTN